MWHDWEPGTRVMVRRTIEDPTHKYTDVLGTITRNDPDTLVLETRRGEVEVPWAVIVTGKKIPPPPQRRNRPAPSPLHD